MGETPLCTRCWGRGRLAALLLLQAVSHRQLNRERTHTLRTTALHCTHTHGGRLRHMTRPAARRINLRDKAQHNSSSSVRLGPWRGGGRWTLTIPYCCLVLCSLPLKRSSVLVRSSKGRARSSCHPAAVCSRVTSSLHHQQSSGGGANSHPSAHKDPHVVDYKGIRHLGAQLACADDQVDANGQQHQHQTSPAHTTHRRHDHGSSAAIQHLHRLRRSNEKAAQLRASTPHGPDCLHAVPGPKPCVLPAHSAPKPQRWPIHPAPLTMQSGP